MEKHLNIVSFNIPYPASYGGVIDVFYKLKALHACGVKIILHAFEYGRVHTDELNRYCEEVHYYQRETGWLAQISVLPYIVNSRKNKSLLANLLKNDYPVLFEGLHTCYYLDHPGLKDRLKLVRTHNIEHAYYDGLSKNSDSLWKKIYLLIESKRLKYYERKLKFANYILSLSTTETVYFQHKYGHEKVLLFPLFHPNTRIEIQQNSKPYVLYHGDLSTPENIKTALFLIDKIAGTDDGIPWVIAGLNPDKSIYRAASQVNNVEVKANLSDTEIKKVIAEASVNILITNQVSGVKLKLINALFNGHFCLANKQMVTGSGLEELCVPVPDEPERIREQIRLYLHKDFSETEIEKRMHALAGMYDNTKNAQKMVELIT